MLSLMCMGVVQKPPDTVGLIPHQRIGCFGEVCSHNESYRELGANYFDERRRQFTIDRLTRRIEHLGYRVHLEPVAVPAA